MVISAQHQPRRQRGQTPALRDLLLFLQTGDMGQQFLLTGHAAKVPADHLIGSQGGFLPRPQADQHTGDDGGIDLQFDAVLTIAEQMTAAQHMLEEPEKYLNRPAAFIDRRNRFGVQVKPVGGNPQNLALFRAAANGVMLFDIGRAFDGNQTNRCQRCLWRCRRPA